MPDDEKPKEGNVSEESPPEPALPEKPADEPVPDDIMSVLAPFIEDRKEGGNDSNSENSAESEVSEEESKRREKPPGKSGTPVGEMLPPREFFDWLLEHKGSKLTKRQKEILLYAYNHPEMNLNQLAIKGSFSYSHSRKTVEKLQNLYKQYSQEFELEGAPLEPEPLEPVPATIRQAGKKGSRRRGRPPANGEEQMTKYLVDASKATTTFKEVDKTIAKVLGADFHDAAVKKNVYARLGELLIYTLLQLGAIDRDRIVEYSQTLVDDPDALYFYVKEQLDAVIKITDPETLQHVWMENAQLRMKVMALEATADMLSDALNYYGDTIRALIGLLNKKQLEKFATWVYMSEYMRKMRKKKVGGVGVGGAGSATGRV